MTGLLFPTQITRREWRRVLLYALVLTLAVSLPYWLGWATQDSDHVFSGFLFGVDDGNSYLGKMRLGARGQWDFHLFYTAEAHDSAGLLFLPYIVPGQVVGLFISQADPALSPTLLGVFHLLRVIFDVLLVAVLYRFIAVYLRPARLRFFALVLATLGGGFGWLLLVVGSVPPEWFIPEGFTLQILFGLPHLALARAALLLGLLALMNALARAEWLPSALVAGACWLLVGIAVPFYLAVIYAILGAWGLALWLRDRAFPVKMLVRGLVAAGLTLPLFAYNAWVFSSNPAFAQWSAQNLLPSPPPLHYLLAYLPLGVLALMAGRWAWRRARLHGRYALLVAWPLIVPLLVYLPLNVQRRLAEAVIVPLAILAAAGAGLLVRRWARRSHQRAWKWARLLVFAATLPASLLLLIGAYFSALSSAPPVKYPAAQMAAIQWLNRNSEPGEVVLSAFETGNIIPAYANLRVYVGHGPETLYAVPKTAEATRFFRDEMSAGERAALYADQRIRYVFYGANERTLAGSPQREPDWAQDLTLIYEDGDYAIYEV